jgi:hypothetical protein
MKKHLKLEINNPCSENFDNFKKTNKGGYCESCKTEVIDFRKMNDAQIIKYFSTHSSKSICGKFKPEQLKINELQSSKYRGFGFLKGIGLALLSLFAFNTTQAQAHKTDSLRSEKKSSVTLPLSQMQFKYIEITPIKDSLKEKGSRYLVTGKTDEKAIAIPGFSIHLMGTRIKVQTDDRGILTLDKPLKAGDFLSIELQGFGNDIILIEDPNAIHIDLKLPYISSTGAVGVVTSSEYVPETKKVIRKRKRLLRRLRRKAKNEQ